MPAKITDQHSSEQHNRIHRLYNLSLTMSRIPCKITRHMKLQSILKRIGNQ